MAQQILAAVIGPKDSVDDCIAYSYKYPQLTFVPLSYESEKETREIVQSLQHQFDVILFTGPVPYYHAVDLDEVRNTPTVYIPFGGSSLYRALFQIRLENMGRISIDTISQGEIQSAYSELGIPNMTKHILEYDRALTLQEFVDFHKNAYDSGETSFALTCLRSCYLRLKELGVPALRVFPLQSVIRETLDKIALIGEGIQNKASQIVVGRISTDHSEQWSHKKTSHELQRLQLTLQQMILRYVEEIDGHFVSSSSNEYLFFTTRALFEKSTNFFTVPPLLEKIRKVLPFSVSIGVGYGGTANQAGIRANAALNKAKEFGGDACFVIHDNHQVTGPIGESHSVTVVTRTTDKGVLEQVDNVGVSATVFNRLMEAIHQTGAEFTANDLAAYLNITLRSTRRLLKQMEEAHVIEVIGQESLHTKGKPRRVYRLLGS
ncbi:hypothetical protein [Ferviditalea candida]|uniref:Transcriptional regulator n=1 Tax=Ferviditalea candida TaxID=3108399 RepID=A0ABU5ZEQ1_9BACL|nr:hypothetical protein [Paenibacillaceae bacterium T2]